MTALANIARSHPLVTDVLDRVATGQVTHQDTSVLITFANGYQASVVRGIGTYGSDSGLYELAVMHGDDGLVYDTPITDDVLGYLHAEELPDLFAAIAALPTR